MTPGRNALGEALTGPVVNRRTSTALLGAGGGLLLVVTGLVLLDVYVPATLPSVPETDVLSEETLVPLLALGGALVAWAVSRRTEAPPLVALPLGGGLAALLVRLPLGLATASLDAGATDLLLGALQTLALGLAVGAVAAAGLSYPERSETAGAAVLAVAGVVIASTAFGTSLDQVLYAVLAALVGGAPIALGVPLWRRSPRVAGAGRRSSSGTGGADPGDPFAEPGDGGMGGGSGAEGGTATAGGEARAAEPRTEQSAPDEAGETGGEDGEPVEDLAEVVPDEKLGGGAENAGADGDAGESDGADEGAADADAPDDATDGDGEAEAASDDEPDEEPDAGTGGAETTADGEDRETDDEDEAA